MRTKLPALLAALLLAGLALAAPARGDLGTSAVGGKGYQGEEVTCDLPLAEMFWNIGSHLDGLGMCVDSSLEMGGRFQGVPGIRGFRDWAARFGGGSYPSKVDQQVPAYFKAKGLPTPDYLQYTGSDPAELRALLELIDKTGRIACVAYGYDPRYGGSGAINHMVYSPKPGSGKYACVVDNNAVGGVTGSEAARYVWMSRDAFEARMRVCAGRGGRVTPTTPWVFVWLAAPPPPVPVN